MSQPTTEIIFDRESGDYACYLNDTLIGFAKTYVAGEILINTTLGSHPLVAQNISMQIAKLALEYGKATNDLDRKAIKTEAKRLMAIRDGIEYDVFTQEHAAYVAEQQAA